MSKFKIFFLKLSLIFSLITIFIFISARSYSKNMFKNISNNFLRLHVVANSDSTEDQILKYKIRDAVIDYMKPYFSNINTKKDALEILNSQKNNITNLAKKIATDNGYTYPVTVFIGNFYFPTKEYSEIILPEGYYDALKIELGDAKGQNWWCVMFPSLCFIDISSGIVNDEAKENLEENLDNESYNLISNTSTETTFKFKLVEFFADKKLFTANK